MPHRLPTLLAVCAGLLGCAPAAPNSQVEKDWLDTVRRFSLLGIYPPTEDVQPGDVLLDVPPAATADPQPHAVRLGSLDRKVLLGAMKDQTGKRLVLDGDAEATMAKSPAPPPNRTGGSPSYSQIASYGRPGPQAPDPPSPHVLDAETPQSGDGAPRFQRVALPGMTAARIQDWQIGGAGPIGWVAVGLGLSSAGQTAVVMHLDNLEMLGIDATDEQTLLRDNVVRWLHDKGLTPAMLLKLAARANPDPVGRICRGDPPPSGPERAVVHVVNRVLYVHDIEYEYTRDSQFAGRLAADIAQTAAAKELAPAAAPTAPAPPPAPSKDNLSARVAANAAAAAAITPSTVGLRTVVGVGTYGNASLSKHYPRPIAVGFAAAQSFTLRSALITSAPTQWGADAELAEVREFCNYEAAGPASTAGDDEHLSPVEARICKNMTTPLSVAPWLANIIVPHRCNLPAAVETSDKENGFKLVAPRTGNLQHAYSIN